MDPFRVLICHCEMLLGLGINSLLSGHEDIIIESCTPVNEMEYFSCIDRLQPDIVILGECSPLAQEPTLSRILHRSHHLQVIIPSVRNNWLNIYQKRQVLLENASDLITVIQATGER